MTTKAKISQQESDDALKRAAATFTQKKPGDPPASEPPANPPPAEPAPADAPPTNTPPADPPAKAEPEEDIVIPPDELFGDGAPPDPKPKEGEPPAPAHDDDLNPPADLSLNERQAASFKAGRLREKELKARLAAAEAKLKDTSNNSAVQELTEKLNAAYDEIGKFNLARDPRFVQKFEQPMKTLQAQAEGIVKEMGGDEGIIQRASSMGLRDRVEFLNGELPAVAPSLISILTSIDTLRNNMQEAMNDHAKRIDSIRAQEDAEMTKARQEIFDQSLTTVRDQMKHSIFKEIPGNDKWNSQVAKIVAAAKDIMGGSDPAQQTQAIILGVAAPLYKGLYSITAAENKKLKAQLAAYSGARPRVNGVSPDNQPAPKNSAGVPMISAGDAAKSLVASASK